jgi:type IV pilus assembly protein PilC
VKSNVEGGATFADSLKRHPKVFDSLFVNLVAAGEIGGILDTILNRLATYIEKNVKLVRQVKGAMVYPMAIMIIALGVVAALLKWVIPTFEQMFSNFGNAKDCIRLGRSNRLKVSLVLIMGPKETALELGY